MRSGWRLGLLGMAFLAWISGIAWAQGAESASLPSWFSGFYQGAVSPFGAWVLKFLSFLPTLIGVLVIVILGAFVAQWAQIGIATVLGVDAVERVAAKAVKKPLAKAGMANLGEVLGSLTYYVLIVITLVIAVDYSGILGSSRELIRPLLAYVPNVIAALFVAILGLLLANFFAVLVRLIAANLGIEEAEGLSKLVRLVIVIFTGIVSLRHLGIAFGPTVQNLDYLFLAICLALALAFGLGCRDLARRYVAGVIKKYGKKGEE